MTPAKGPKKMVYPFMKLKNLSALSRDTYGQLGYPLRAASSPGQNLPGTQGPTPNKRANYLPASDVNIL